LLEGAGDGDLTKGTPTSSNDDVTSGIIMVKQSEDCLSSHALYEDTKKGHISEDMWPL